MNWYELPQHKIIRDPIIVPMLLAPVDNCFTMVNLFNYFLKNEIIDIIVNCTNKRLNSDQITSRKEIKAFIGLLLIFGFTKKNDIEINMILKEDSLHYCKWAAITMGRDRFQTLSSFITFDDMFSRKTREKTMGKYFVMQDIFEMIRDAIDQQCEKFTCRRKTARWNFNTFMYLIDVISLNSIKLN